MIDADSQRLADRLTALRAEYASGEQQLAALDARATQLRQTMLRISGAVQVLEELLAASGAPGASDG